MTVTERFFYHSFPRKSRDLDAEIDNGCAILQLVRDFGLLLTPESVTFGYDHGDGSPSRTTEILQRRVCFTELAPSELGGHAKKFGHFALEFTIPVLKSLGAIPVFYIPRAISDTKGAEGAASTLVMQFMDAMILVMRISSVGHTMKVNGISDGPFECTFGFKETGNKVFNLDAGEIQRVLGAFTHAITPPDDLLPTLEAMLNFFAYADSRDDVELEYYREREWRIGANMAIQGEKMMRRPSQELVDLLKTLDGKFFGKIIAPTGKTRAELSYVLPGLKGSRIIEMANRIIVPSNAVVRVTSLLSSVRNPPAVVSLEEVARA